MFSKSTCIFQNENYTKYSFHDWGFTISGNVCDDITHTEMRDKILWKN